jgi:hypothetical protein
VIRVPGVNIPFGDKNKFVPKKTGDLPIYEPTTDGEPPTKIGEVLIEKFYVVSK